MLRLMTVVVFLLISCGAKASQFMQDNNLWMQDCLYCESANGMTEELFNKIIDAGKVAYASPDEKLVINNKWSDSTVNANVLRRSGTVTINMYGGLARRDEVLPEAFALVLSHELGHAYGGIPYIQVSNRMSAEGQADYMAAFEGYKKISKLVPELNADITTDDFIKNACKGESECIHSLEGGKSLGLLLSTLMKETAPDYATPDPLVVSKTVLTYPDTTQCRLDTYFAGTLGLVRPACWFFK